MIFLQLVGHSNKYPGNSVVTCLSNDGKLTLKYMCIHDISSTLKSILSGIDIIHIY